MSRKNVVQVGLEPEEVAELADWAEEDRRTLSSLARRILSEALERRRAAQAQLAPVRSRRKAAS